MTSTLSAEHDSQGSRAKLVLTVFASIGLGGMAAGIVYVILLAAFKSSIEHDVYQIQWVWRLLFGIGLIPAIFTLYARIRMRETKAYEKCECCPTLVLPYCSHRIRRRQRHKLDGQ